MKISEEKILDLLKSYPEEAMSKMYDQYFHYLTNVVFRMLRDINETQDIVQNVFIGIWEKKEHLNINISLKQYLRRAAVNKSLNYLRSVKLKENSEGIEKTEAIKDYDHSLNIEADELNAVIEQAIDELPNRCRLIFVLSRFENMTYKQIAENLNISIKTVENQMTKALKLLRYKVYNKY